MGQLPLPIKLDDRSFLGCRVNVVGQRGKMPFDAVWKIKTNRSHLNFAA